MRQPIVAGDANAKTNRGHGSPSRDVHYGMRHRADAGSTVAETGKGKALVNAKGMTLYTFDKDAAGRFACNGPCAQNWPPLLAAPLGHRGIGPDQLDGRHPLQWFKTVSLYEPAILHVGEGQQGQRQGWRRHRQRADAISAHRIFVVETAHPVEVGAARQPHPIQWLSRRRGHQRVMSACCGVAALACLILIAGCVARAQVASAHVDSFQSLMDASMARMHRAMMLPGTGDPDRDFAAMMIPHHQGAVEMAEAELRFGRDERLRRLAQGIIVEQRQEIAVMRQVLETLPPVALPSATRPPMVGHDPSHPDKDR